MRTIIITAADEKFKDLLKNLVSSLRQWNDRAMPDLACLDLGLSDGTKSWLVEKGVQLATPGWDLPVEEQIRIQRPQARALTARPFLREYFPGYDIYMWMDSDAWIQESFALDWYLSAAATKRMALTPEIDRCYRPSEGVHAWKARRMQAYYGDAAAKKLSWAPYYNAGVFALHSDAPHWKRWAEYFTQGLETSNSTELSDQTALNYMLWETPSAVFPLPALCNWLCHLALPSFNPASQKFQEPVSPKRNIGILHLAADAKDKIFHYRSSDNEVVSSNFLFKAEAA